jgi:hypothetical protein
MSTIAATFWLVLVSLEPTGTQYWYMQEFGSAAKCHEVVSTIRSGDGIDWNKYGVRCTDEQPLAGVYAFSIPPQG